MKSWHWVAIAAVVGIVVFVGKKGYEMTRGIRNKNPGNIRSNAANNWQGQIGRDHDGFVVFDTAQNGIRAIARLLKNYISAGHNTVEKVIARYAPASENDTSAYIAAVSKRVAVSPDFPLAAYHIEPLVTAIIQHENGLNPYTVAEIRAGIAAAGV